MPLARLIAIGDCWLKATAQRLKQPEVATLNSKLYTLNKNENIIHCSSATTRAWLVDGEQVYQGEYTDTGELRL